MKIDKNKVQIRTNWQKGTETKKPKNFRNLENCKEKKGQNSPLCSISDLNHNSWPGTLDHLVLSLVNDR